VISDALLLIAANACFWSAGWGVLRLMRGPRGAGLGGGAVAYLVGVATVGVLATLLLLAGASLSVLQVVLLCGALCALGFVRDRRVRLRRPDLSPWWALLAVTAFLAILGVDLFFQPLWSYDAWAQWTPKAKSFVLFNGLDARFFETTTPNSDYPILVPALEAIDFRFMGGFGTQVVHLQFFLLIAGYVAALLELLERRACRLFTWAVVATVVVAPSLGIQAASAVADVPLAIFFSVAGLYAWIALVEGDRRALPLLSVFASAALVTKNEGALFVGTLFAVLLAVHLAGRAWRSTLLTAVAGAVSLVGLVPWRLWAGAHRLTNDYAGSSLSLSRLGRVPTAAVRLATEAFDPTSWLALLPLVLLAGGLAWTSGRSRQGVFFVALTFALINLELVIVYWATALPFDYDLDTTARRVITSPLLFAAGLTPILLEHAALGARHGLPPSPQGPA
jgi:hypothetical protein